MATASVVSVNTLCEEKRQFYVPAYQRGYRWTTQNMKELIMDLDGFFNGNVSDKHYCMQPIVVKKEQTEDGKDRWVVVDGQQRLMAMWILMTLGSVSDDSTEKKNVYKLFFENKPSMNDFVDTVETQILNHDDLDSTFRDSCENILNPLRSKSVDCVNAVENMLWVITPGNGVTRNGSARKWRNYLSLIMNNLDKIDFIEYKLGENEDPIETFANINANKIRLTNSELLKAVILNALSDDENEMKNMGRSWEQLEKELHDEDFWRFIKCYNAKVQSRKKDKESGTRLDFLFEIWCRDDKKAGGAIELDSEDELAVFHAVDEYLKASQDPRKAAYELCQSIISINDVLHDWYGEHDWYHEIGALVAITAYEETEDNAKLIADLFNIYNSGTKKQFNQELKSKMKDHFCKALSTNASAELKVEKVREGLKKIDYSSKHEDRTKITIILLLYNIAVLINSKNAGERFSFSLFGKQYWDIEHVNPQTPLESSEEEKRAWLESYRNFFEKNADDLCLQIKMSQEAAEAKDSETETDDLKKAIGKLLKHIDDVKSQDNISGSDLTAIEIEMDKILYPNKKNDITNDNIRNLVLLDAKTNREYHNSCFADKRKHVLKIERNMLEADETETTSAEERREKEKRFLLPGTKWVFFKAFSESRELLIWGLQDMNEYCIDIAENIIGLVEEKKDGE